MRTSPAHLDYGFIGALRLALDRYDAAGRQTGRTASMVAALQPGDVIVAKDERHASFLQGWLTAASQLNIKVVIVPPTRDALAAPEFRLSSGVYHFDHLWIAAFLESALQGAYELLELLSNRAEQAVPRDYDPHAGLLMQPHPIWDQDHHHPGFKEHG